MAVTTEGGGDFKRGTAGASAAREHARRQANREQRVRDANPLLGGVLLAFHEAPQHEVRWRVGAEGEAQVAAAVAKGCGASVIPLHDRLVPDSRANIDHIIVASSGVWVIDTKRYKGKVEVIKPWLGEPKLKIAGRDQTKLVDGIQTQVELVTQAMADIDPNVPTRGAFCFVAPEGFLAASGLPALRTLTIRGFPLLLPRGLVKRLGGKGDADAARISAVAAALTRRSPSA